MAHKVIDRCKETTSTTGTGNLTLTGAVSGFVSMANAATGLTSNGDTGWFCAEAGAQWEVFLGTRISATELERTTLLASSTGSTINFTAPPVVFSTVPAQQFVAPAFRSYRATSNQALTSGSYTKVQLQNEAFDEGGCFDSSTNYRWTPNVPGYYMVSFAVALLASSGMTYGHAAVYKNGTVIGYGSFGSAVVNNYTSTGAVLVYMNGTTDYLELFAMANGTSPAVIYGEANTYFNGFLAR